MKKIILVITFLSLTGYELVLAEPFVTKGIVSSDCEGILTLKNLDEKRTKQIGISVVQSFISGYNLRYFQEHKYKKFKDVNVKPEVAYNYLIRKCTQDPKKKVNVILLNYWYSLEWGQR